jgi:pyoverdine/dityrosine biosynthesis protein Dit1
MIAQNLETLNFAQMSAIAIKAVLKLSSADSWVDDFREIPLMKDMVKKMIEGQKLTFVLPAFPAKSPSPYKTSGIHPDMGEVMALTELNDMCKKISEVHPAGAEVVICSDGRVFSDVVMVDDETIDVYQRGIQEIIDNFNLTHLSTFSMDDLHPELSGTELRERLSWQFGKSVEEVRHLVRTDSQYNSLFNGIHKFMVEDQIGISTKSKNQINKEMKEKTYELLRRSDAWSALLKHYKKDTLRLSIHPYPLNHEKFGIKLLPTSTKWATPWHNVTVKKDGKYELMHLREAQLMGATEKKFGGKYVYFEL